MNRKMLILVVLMLMIVTCKGNEKKATKGDDNTGEEVKIYRDFKEYWKIFNEVVENQDRDELSLLLADDVYYSVGYERDQYSRDEIIEKFDFELTKKILSEGYYLSDNNFKAFCPPDNENMTKYEYILRFINKENGWKLRMMDMMH